MKKDADGYLLCSVLARFPESETRIRELFQDDEAFCELCGDHAECLAVLRRFQEAGTAPDERIEEYTEMLVRLEEEVSVRISEPANGEPAVEARH